MLGWRPLALGMASSLFFVAAAEAQQANAKRVATTEPLPATAPAVAPAPQPQDPIGIALQQKLSAPAKARADDADAQERAALAGFLRNAGLCAGLGVQQRLQRQSRGGHRRTRQGR